MLEFILSILSGLTPAAALPWALCVAMGIYIGVTLRAESETERKLRADVAKLNALHNQTVIALTNNRVADLVALNGQYEKLVKEVLSVLNKFSKDKK